MESMANQQLKFYFPNSKKVHGIYMVKFQAVQNKQNAGKKSEEHDSVHIEEEVRKAWV